MNHVRGQRDWPLRSCAIAACLLFAAHAHAQLGDKAGEVQRPLPAHLIAPPSPPLAPEDALKTFEVAEGFRIELLAAEPLVEDPVVVTFDGDGRAWVVEMRGFMPNIDGDGEDAPVGRIAILEDVDGDGDLDRRTTFLDGLVMPRGVAVVKGGALVADYQKLIYAEDVDGDDRADRTTVIDPEYSVGGNVEHQPNGLMRGIDNWYYNAKSRYRYRLIGGRWMREETEFRGQWGISQDDFGRLIYNYNWDQLRGDVAPPSYLMRNANHVPSTGINVPISVDQRVYPIRMNTAVNRGYREGILDERGRLRQFASACGPVIYRGSQYPREFAGNAFVCGPGANIVKRNILFEDGLTLTSQHAYADREFVASTDERFRPVSLADAPDGTLWIVDMYRGIIQHRQYMTTYLRDQTLSRGLDKHVNLGRLYRVVHEGSNPRTPPKLSKKSAAELVAYLSDENGWVRDTAQRLLVERGERSVIPALRELALRGDNPLGRIHALWTLEGLGDDRPLELLAALRDSHPKVQAAALRVLELLCADDESAQRRLLSELQSPAAGADLQVQYQIALTAGNLSGPNRLDVLARIITAQSESPEMRDAVMSSINGQELDLLRALWNDAAWREAAPGRSIFLEAVASSIVRARDADQIKTLLAMIDTEPGRFNWRHEALLAGITIHAANRRHKPIELAKQPGILEHCDRFESAAIRSRIDDLKRLFEWPGHRVAAATTRSRALSERQQQLFIEGRQQYLVYCAACHGPDGAGMKPLGPPLLDSEWVTGSPQRLIRIVLHGMEGPVHVAGVRYEPPSILPNMPPVPALNDEQTAAVLTYIRQSWDHDAEPIAPNDVGQLRQLLSGRIAPWSEDELLEIE